jgi:hypothetical protein
VLDANPFDSIGGAATSKNPFDSLNSSASTNPFDNVGSGNSNKRAQTALTIGDVLDYQRAKSQEAIFHRARPTQTARRCVPPPD